MTEYHQHKCGVLFIGFTVQEKVIERIVKIDRFMPVQTYKFSWSVVRSLENNGVIVDLLSAEPVGTYPAHPQIFFKPDSWRRDNRSWNVVMPFVNLLGLKHATRFISCLWLTSWWLVKNRHTSERIILLHGVHSPFMFAALTLRKLWSFKIVTIVTDPPGVSLPGEGHCINYLRRFDSAIIVNSLQAMNGLITLTPQLAQHYAPKVPAITIEGFLSINDIPIDQESENLNKLVGNNDNHFTLLYAGGLKEEYGVGLLLEAFSQIKCPSFRLWVLGKGEFESQIQMTAESDPRIIFFGYRPHGDVIKLINKSTVLINPRPSNQSFTQFSFPSKLIEYMVSGRPVISTRLPGIPDDYLTHLYLLENESGEGLAELLKRLNSMPNKNLSNFGEEAKQFIMDKKNETAQGKTIIHFLNQLLS